MDTKPILETMVLERLQIGIAQSIAPEQLQSFHLDIAYSAYAQKYETQLRGYLLCKRHKTERWIADSVNYPATWWDAVKERFFPRLTVRRITRPCIVYLTKVYVCPHLPIPTSGDTWNQHLNFMEIREKS